MMSSVARQFDTFSTIRGAGQLELFITPVTIFIFGVLFFYLVNLETFFALVLQIMLLCHISVGSLKICQEVQGKLERSMFILVVGVLNCSQVAQIE